MSENFKTDKNKDNDQFQGDIIIETDPIETDGTIANVNQSSLIQSNQNSISQFIEWPITRAGGEYQPIQYRTGGHILASGISQENLQIALLIHAIMLSAPLGYPVSAMLVSEDMQTGIKLLYRCQQLVPGKFIVEFQDVRPEHLYINGGESLNGKCIFSIDANGLKKVYRDLGQVLTRGYSVRQELSKGKYDVGLAEHRSKIAVSVLGIENGKPGKGFDHPSILKIMIHSSGGPLSQVEQEVFEQYDLIRSPIFKMRKSFQRLKPREVMIPFEGQLADAILASGCDYPMEKLQILKNLISICTIINNPPPVHMAEIGSYMYETDVEEVNRWLISAGLAGGKESNTSLSAPLMATKVDYFIAQQLLNGILLTGHMRFTDRQKKVFESVKAINMGKMTTAIVNKGDTVEMLSTIARNQGYWAAREKIYEKINVDGELFSLSSISNDLIELIELGVLERAKPQKTTYFGYYIVTMDLNNTIKLPDPSTIQDPVYEGKEVMVINPITGQVDKI